MRGGAARPNRLSRVFVVVWRRDDSPGLGLLQSRGPAMWWRFPTHLSRGEVTGAGAPSHCGWSIQVGYLISNRVDGDTRMVILHAEGAPQLETVA